MFGARIRKRLTDLVDALERQLVVTRANFDGAHPFREERVTRIVEDFIDAWLLDAPMDRGTLLNVNFPACAPDAVRGVRVVRQGLRDYGRLRIDQRTDPRGFNYYWFGLAQPIETPGHATDLEAVADNFIAVTPLHLDLTHTPSLAPLAARFADPAPQ